MEDKIGEFSSFVVNGKKYNVYNFSVMEALTYHLEFLENMGGFMSSLGVLFFKEGISLKKEEGKTQINEEMLLKVFSQLNSEKAKKIVDKVLKRVMTPEQVILDNQSSVQDWFGRPENSGDVWMVVLNAMLLLLGEYMPSMLNTAILGLHRTIAAMSAFQTDKKSEVSLADQSAEG